MILLNYRPQYDIDQRTAKLAANFIYEIIHHHISSSKRIVFHDQTNARHDPHVIFTHRTAHA